MSAPNGALDRTQPPMKKRPRHSSTSPPHTTSISPSQPVLPSARPSPSTSYISHTILAGTTLPETQARYAVPHDISVTHQSTARISVQVSERSGSSELSTRLVSGVVSGGVTSPYTGAAASPYNEQDSQSPANSTSRASATASREPLSPQSFYSRREVPTWMFRRHNAGFKPSQRECLQMFAAFVFALQHRREAPHYATWDLAAHEHFSNVKILPHRLKVTVSTICPQYPLVSQETVVLPVTVDDGEDSESEDEDPEGLHMIDAELFCEVGHEDTTRDGAQDASAGTVRDTGKPSSPHVATEADDALEIKQRIGSTRIPDFTQLSHVFDLDGLEYDVFLAIEKLCTNADAFATLARDVMPHLRSQVTHIFEIKPPGPYKRTQIALFQEQLDGQAAHFFASGVKESTIGGILALGYEFTYRELRRKSTASDRKKFMTNNDDADYQPSLPKVQVHQSRQPVNKRTNLETQLKAIFKGGHKFLDMHSSEGKAALDLINLRTMELFPVFWGHNTKYDERLRPSVFT